MDAKKVKKINQMMRDHRAAACKPCEIYLTDEIVLARKYGTGTCFPAHCKSPATQFQKTNKLTEKSLLLAEADAIGTKKNNRSYAEPIFLRPSEDLSGVSRAGSFGGSSSLSDFDHDVGPLEVP